MLVANERETSVWFVNIDNPAERQEVIASLDPAPDGLVIEDGLLYVTLNLANRVQVYQLEGETAGDIAATLRGCYFSDQFDTPSTSAILKGFIYSANSRFANFSDASEDTGEDDNVIGIPLDDMEACT